MPGEKVKYGLRIRRRAIVFFLIFVLAILLPRLFFDRVWLLYLNKEYEIRLLEQHYNSIISHLNSQYLSLRELADSYSQNKDVAKFIQKNDESYLAPLKKKQGFDLFLVLNDEGKVVGNISAGLLSDSGILDNSLSRSILSKDNFSGLWRAFDGQFWIIASSSIMPENLSGSRRASVILGRRINEDFLRNLGLSLEVQVEFLPVDPMKSFTDKHQFVIGKIESKHELQRYYLDSVLTDVNSNPVVVLRIKDARGNNLWFQRYILFFLWATFVLVVLLLLYMVKFLTRHITTPLIKLRQAIQDITSSKNLSERLKIVSEDEIGGLIHEFNDMLDELEEMNRRINASNERLSILYKDLLEQKKFTSEILSTAPSIILVLSPNGRVKFVNDAIEPITGYKAEEVFGLDWFENFIPFGIRQEYKFIFQECLKGNTSSYRQRENEILTKDGSQCHILWNNSTLFDKEGNVTAVISIGQDITEHRKTEFELRRKMRDLERFYKATIDREKVVIELKNQIKELNARLERIQKSDG